MPLSKDEADKMLSLLDDNNIEELRRQLGDQATPLEQRNYIHNFTDAVHMGLCNCYEGDPNDCGYHTSRYILRDDGTLPDSTFKDAVHFSIGLLRDLGDPSDHGFVMSVHGKLLSAIADLEQTDPIKLKLLDWIYNHKLNEGVLPWLDS